ncbi:MAG: NUDIX domain-containing protein [Snodgrassella sp.]|nr:NUDIX domain-containing protein [Snodgrassella sp.]
MSKSKLIEVVAGVLYNHEGAFLLSSRPEGKPYAGYWEFAGGKVEMGESRLTALQREFIEELGIQIQSATPWLTRVHHYEHAHVHLHFFRIAASQWHGQLTARENQSWHWQKPNASTVSPMLPANAPILAALAIPTAFTGKLKSGFSAKTNHQLMQIQPYQANLSPNTLVFATASQLPTISQHHPRSHIWTICQNRKEWYQAQSTAAVIWPLRNQHDRQQLLNLLQQSDIPLPIMVLYTENYTDDINWMALGVHGIIKESENV